MMAADPPGTTNILRDGRAEVLQSLVSTLDPGESASTEIPSKEDVSKLSDKLKQLLGDVDPPSGTVVQRNEKGELQNEEGLPIVEITEPMEKVPEPASGASSGTGPVVDTEDTNFVPMHRLPPAEKARSRARMGHILDMLEEEERIEEDRHQARDREQRREELEQRRANARAELERAKTAKEMQKKMGKALLKNMADAREKEEEEKARQEREDLEREEARKSRKPRKSVSWAELPKLERSDDDVAVPNLPGKLPMRPYVVERFPARSGASSPPPPIPMSDSDDESEPPSSAPSDSDTPSGIPSDGIPFPTPEHDQSDGSEDDDEPLESHGSEDGFDIDSMQHQREIALAYFEKRNTIGADAARAMSAHSHNLDGDENDWGQEDVPDPMLAEPRPKPSRSKFKSERIAQAYFGETQLPSSTPPTSLGTSAVLPNSTSGTLRSAVRIGRLEGGQLVGNGDSDREDDEDDVSARTRELMDVLRRGDVTNVGAAENSDALIAALEAAYGAPPKEPPSSAQAHLTAPPPTSAAASGAAPLPPKKSSRFKLERTVPPPTIAEDEGLREGSADTTAREHGTTLSATSRPSPSPAPTRVVGSLPVPDTSPASQSPTMIIDSPSFAPPPGGVPMTTTIIDSPSFQKPQFPLPSAKPMRPSSRPPTVMSSVRESSGTPRQQETPGHEPGKKVSRFKAQLAES